MNWKIILLLFGLLALGTVYASDPPEVIGLCISAPGPDHLEQFISFMENGLAPGGINTLVLRIDLNYEYES